MSLGLSIAGGKGAAVNRIFVVDVKPGGPAERDGRIIQGDEILEVNQISVRGLSHYQASAILKSTSSDVELILGRSREAEEFLAANEMEQKPLNIEPAVSTSVESVPESQQTQTQNTETRSITPPSKPAIAPKPTLATSKGIPPPVAPKPITQPTVAKTVSPTLVAELSGGQHVEYINIVKVTLSLDVDMFCLVHVCHFLLNTTIS